MIFTSDSDHPIDRIRGGLMVAIAGEVSEEIVSLIHEQEKVVERELKEVPGRAEARGADFVAQAKEPLAKMMQSLENYAGWLVAARESISSGETSAIVAAFEASHDVLPELSDALAKYSGMFSSYGPHKTAPANEVARLAEGIRAALVEPQDWAKLTAYHHQGLVRKAASIEEVLLPGRSVLVAGYQEAAQEMLKLKAMDPADENKLSLGIQAFDKTLHPTEQLEKLISESVSGATEIPSTNVLLAVAKASRQDGKVSAEDLESAIEDYSEIVDTFSEAFEESVNRPVESVLVQDEIPRTLDFLDAHYAAVEELTLALEADDQTQFDSALDKLTETAQKLGASRQVYATVAKHQDQILCTGCGRSNPPENRICEVCGTALPRSDDASSLTSSTFSVMASQQVLEENQQLVLTENVSRLFLACDDVADGKITPEEFDAELRRAALGLKDFREELDDMVETMMDRSEFSDEQWEVWQTQHLAQLQEVAAGFVHGVSECHVGLERMGRFLEEPDEQHLIKGVSRVWEGLGVIHRSQLSFQTYSKMLDDVMSEARADGLITSDG